LMPSFQFTESGLQSFASSLLGILGAKIGVSRDCVSPPRPDLPLRARRRVKDLR
jgi:hypothetical protein